MDRKLYQFHNKHNGIAYFNGVKERDRAKIPLKNLLELWVYVYQRGP
jgi:hypothetical protein